jgi:hypothetical protein
MLKSEENNVGRMGTRVCERVRLGLLRQNQMAKKLGCSAEGSKREILGTTIRQFYLKRCHLAEIRY